MSLRAGIIGLGVGEAHIRGFQSHPQCEVVALCDRLPQKRQQAKSQYPQMAIYESAKTLLEDPNIDAVAIASYDDDHYEQVVKAMQQGKHVFVEKPLCQREDHAKHIAELHQRHSRLKLSSNLILRHYPKFIRLREMIRAGSLGELFLIEGDYNYGRLEKITDGWRGKLDFYSVVYGGGVHIVDLFTWLTNDRVVEVAACGNRIASRESQFKFNDLVVCLMRFQSGMVGKMAVNFGCVYPHFHRCTFYGTEATVVNEPEALKLYKSRDPHVATEMLSGFDKKPAKGDLLYDFVEAIVKDGKTEVSARDIFDVMAICFAIEKAVQCQGFVPVQYFGGCS